MKLAIFGHFWPFLDPLLEVFGHFGRGGHFRGSFSEIVCRRIGVGRKVTIWDDFGPILTLFGGPRKLDFKGWQIEPYPG